MNRISGYEKEVNQIESIAETKGVELDEIDVRESTTDEGDELIVFRILETKGESEMDSVGVQVSKMPSVQTGDMTFRDDVQNKLGALKRHLADENEPEDADDTEQAQTDDTADSSKDESDSTSTTSRTRTRDTRSVSGDGPGAEIDARLTEIEDRLDDLEGRVETIEDKAEALDGLQKLMGSDDE